MALDATTLQSLLPSTYYVNGQLVVPESEAQTMAAGIQARAAALPEAERNLFLALVRSSPDLAPAGQGGVKDINAALEELTQVVAMIGALPGVSRAVIDFLARALIEQAGEQRKQALENRLAARETARSELLSQAAHLNQAASDMRSGAIAALVVTVVMSGVALVTAGGSSQQASSTIGTMRGTDAKPGALTQIQELSKEKTDLLNSVAKAGVPATPGAPAGTPAGTAVPPSTRDFKDLNADEQAAVMARVNAGYRQTEFDAAQATMQTLNADLQQATNLGTIGQTVNQLGQGAANSASTLTQADAKNEEADGSVRAAQAQNAEAIADNMKEIQQSLEDMVKAVINFLKEMQEAKANQMQALTRV